MSTEEDIHAPPQQQARPGVAVLLTLFAPGVGHYYCAYCAKFEQALFKRSLWILGSFWGAWAAVYFARTEFKFQLSYILPPFVRWMVPLYAFALLDAYFTAWELSGGTKHSISKVRQAARIAAILNFLTGGFGYWYAGRKVRGVLSFLIFCGLSLLFLQLPFLRGYNQAPLFREWFAAGTAVSAYRIARTKTGQASARQSSTGLRPLIPLSLVCLIAFVHIGFVFAEMGIPMDARYAGADWQRYTQAGMDASQRGSHAAAEKQFLAALQATE